MANSDIKSSAPSDRGQVSRSAAEVFEQFFVPALFQQWASRMVDAAHIEAGQRVLDVACGSGILARVAAERVGPTGSVVGLDLNEGMLAVARRIAPHIEWRQERAEALPFPENSFDAVGCQFGLMFFEDKPGALREMWRVLRPGGRLAVAVWDSLEHSSGYSALVALVEEYGGTHAADSLRAPFSLGDTAQLKTLVAAAGLPDAQITTHPGQAHFPSIESWMHADLKGWVLEDMFDDVQYARLVDAAKARLEPFVRPDGTVIFDTPAHIIAASKGSGSHGALA